MCALNEDLLLYNACDEIGCEEQVEENQIREDGRSGSREHLTKERDYLQRNKGSIRMYFMTWHSVAER